MSLTPYFRSTVVSCGLVLLVAVVVAGVKLLPFIENAGGALASVGPLAAAAFATVLEVSVLLGTPIGFAWAARILATSNSAVSAVGSATDKGFLRGALVAGMLWAVVSAGLGGLANVELATPGRVANKLLVTARDVCHGSSGLKTVTIPILGSRWRCNDSGPPTLMGELSRANATISYSAKAMTVSEDMTYVELNELKLSLPAAAGRPLMRLTVEGAKLRGFWSLARPVKLGPWGRAFFVSFTAALLGLVAVWLVGIGKVARIRARVYGLLIALSAWLTLLFLDGRDIAGNNRYALVPMAGCLMALCLLFLLRQEHKWRERLPVYRKQLDSTPS